jgi:electron-transferring-flavoprotein dehydrogenase
MAGFLSTLSRRLAATDRPPLESAAAPGMPLQVMCYERADDLGFGVPVVTRALASALFSPIGARGAAGSGGFCIRSIRSARAADRVALTVDGWCALAPPAVEHDALSCPIRISSWAADPSLDNSQVGAELMATGTVQLWPATPVASALIEDRRVAGVRLVDQGTARDGAPASGFVPGMDVRAALTVIGDGPVGNVGRQIDDAFGMPEAAPARLGARMKMRGLPEHAAPPGTVLLFSYPGPDLRLLWSTTRTASSASRAVVVRQSCARRICTSAG